MNARQAVLLATMAVIGAVSFEALAQAPAPAAAARPAVATVGSRPVPRDEWERRSEQALAEFAKRNAGGQLPPELRDLIRRQVLESQIRIELLVLEARRTGVTVSPLEAEAVLKKDPFFNPGGKFDDQRFITIRTTQTARYNDAIAAIQEQLAARKLNGQLEARFRPSDDSLRRVIGPSLTHVTFDHLSLRRSDFDGSYPEPRESDILAWYASHRADYQRPDRASLTVVFVNSPGLSDSIRARPGGAETWTARMKTTADSLLALVRGGGTLEQVAGFLGPRPRTIVTSDNFPGYWRAGADVNRQLFDPRNVGKVIPQALPAAEGWLIVRVDDVEPAHVAPLVEVAREIRGMLRRDRRTNETDYELKALYGRVRDSLAAPGWRFRLAIADTADEKLAPPTEAALDRWYRGHLADYSGFDSRSGGIVSRPYAEVKDEVRARWYSEQRRLGTRLRADALLRAWQSGKRASKAESEVRLREVGPVVGGSVLDPAPELAALTDSVWSYADPRGPGLVATGAGWVVWQAAGKVDRAVPSLEQARPLLEKRLATEKAVEEEAGARRLFDANVAGFAGGSVVHFSRFPITPGPPIDVPLTRAEVEQYHRDHIDKYSAPELVTARHILIAPADASPEADRAARARAEDVLRRARAGEDFAKLARQYSDDPATKDKGGELGTFGRGTMLDAFERAVFALSPGDYAPEPVRTTLGWHVIYCMDHVPAVVHNLDWIYTMVGSDAARAKAARIAAARADSFTRVLRNGAEAKAVAARLGLQVMSLTKPVGESSANVGLADYFQRLDRARPGQLVPRGEKMPGTDYWVTWVDSIGRPGRPSWESARTAAIDAYRRGAGARALDAKLAEMDSLAAAGWTLDSLATLWGGLERVSDAPPGRGLGSLGGGDVLDSLLLESPGHRALAVGSESGWVRFPNGAARIRLLARQAPTGEQMLARLENERAAAIERGMQAYFERLKQRWPVRILDAKMRGVVTARAPEPAGR